MGYTRKDRIMNGMWPKSSKQFAARVENRVLKLGLGIGAAIFSGSGSSASYRRSKYVNSYSAYSVSPEEASLGLSAKSAKIWCIILLFLAPVFQTLGYISYEYWGFWTFFAILFFSTLALCSSGGTFVVIDDTVELGVRARRGFLISSVLMAVMTLFLSLWPLIVKDSERSSLSYILLAFEDIALITNTIACYRDCSTKMKKVQ